jgi:hypothetical protein
MREHSWKVSRNNGFYWWDLRNDAVTASLTTLWKCADLFWKGRVEERHFLTALYLHFDVVYKESEKEWHHLYDPVLSDDTPLPIDCVNIRTRELNFISERLRNWMFLEGEAVWDCEDFHNRWSELGEQDYSHVELPTTGKDFKFTWGKYRGLTIEELIIMKPDYILWVADNTGKITLSDKLRQEILDKMSSSDRG